MKKPSEDVRHALRFAAIQIPGLVAWGLGLAFAMHREWITPALGVSSFILLVLFDVVVYFRSRHTFDAPPQAGAEALPGRTGVALTALEPDGFAQLGSERWRARLGSGGRLEAGAPLRVDEVRGLELIVRAVEDGD